MNKSNNIDPLPIISTHDDVRHRVAIGLANLILRVTDPGYRVGIKNAMKLGFETATARRV